MTKKKTYELTECFLTTILCSKDDGDSFINRIAIQEAIMEKDDAWLVKKLSEARDMCDELIKKLTNGR